MYACMQVIHPRMYVSRKYKNAYRSVVVREEVACAQLRYVHVGEGCFNPCLDVLYEPQDCVLMEGISLNNLHSQHPSQMSPLAS
jgi:hypothetical protein